MVKHRTKNGGKMSNRTSKSYPTYLRHNLLLNILNEDQRSDKNLVLELCNRNGMNLEFASLDLQDDDDIVYLATKQYGESFYFASERLKCNKEFILRLIRIRGSILKFISEELRDDYELVKLAVTCFGGSLEYASYRLKNNLDIVKCTALQYVNSVKYAGEELVNSEGDMLELIAINSTCFKYVSENLKNNKDFCKKAYDINKKVRPLISIEIKKQIFSKNNEEK